ncbi:hypothetical protein V1522DRAFT_440740 [Lipomyces starkeyi]
MVIYGHITTLNSYDIISYMVICITISLILLYTLLSDLYITCNTRFLALAFKGLAYSYLLSVPPGYHGVDVAYAFSDGPAKDEGDQVNATLAEIFQNYIGTFGATGSPNYAGLPYFPRYGANTTVLNVNATNLASRLIGPHGKPKMHILVYYAICIKAREIYIILESIINGRVYSMLLSLMKNN